jgi:hypothetical protein
MRCCELTGVFAGCCAATGACDADANATKKPAATVVDAVFINSSQNVREPFRPTGGSPRTKRVLDGSCMSRDRSSTERDGPFI